MKKVLRFLAMAALVMLPLAARAQQDCTTPIEVYAGQAFAESFDASASLPSCWTVSGTGVWGVGQGDDSQSTGSHGGARNAVITHGTTGAATKLITPVLDMSMAPSAMLSFWMVHREWYGDIDGLNVYYRSDTTATTTWTLLQSFTTACETWTEATVNLPETALSATFQIAFEYVDSYGHGLGLDDIYIGLPPTCFPVVNLMIDAAQTTDESLTLVWSDTSSNSSNYRVYNVTDSVVVAESLNDTTVTVSGLNASTYYMFTVTTDCGGGDYSTPASVGGRTACGDVTTLPWVEDFSTYTDPEDIIPCWSKGATPDDANIYVEDGELMFIYSPGYMSTGAGSFWAVTPTFGEDIELNQLELSFSYHNMYGYNATLLVGVVGTQAYVPGTTPIDTIALLDVTNVDPENAYLSLADYEGEDHNIIFVVNSSAPGVQAIYVAIDDVDLHLLPACARPSNVTLAGATPSTATLSWSGTADSYAYTLFTAVGDTVVATGDVNDTTVTIEDLVEGNSYYFRIVGVCNGADTSGSIADVYFTLEYCTPSLQSVDGQGITRVTFGYGDEVVNNETASVLYGNYVDSVGAAQAGTPVSLNITYYTSGYGTSYGYGTLVWVDWNRNYQFEGSEVVYYGESMAESPTTLNISFVVPATQDTGRYRMRIAAADMYFDSYITSAAAAATASPCFNASYAVAQDYTLHVTEAPECMPPTDLAIASLALDAASFVWNGDASSYEYEVLVGDSVVFTDVTSDTTVALTGLEASENYIFRVRSLCGSDQSMFSSIPFYTGYCTPNPSSVDHMGITNVTFGIGDEVVNNNNTPATQPYYGDYSSMIGAVPASTELDVSITYTTGYTYGTIIWVDWNRNLMFDGDEVVWVGESANSSPATLLASFTVPTTQDTGLYRMRIAGADMLFDNYTGSIADAADANPCFSDNYAMAHDYTVRVLPAPSCISPRDLTLDSASATTLSLSWTPQGDEEEWIVTLNDSIVVAVQDSAVTIQDLEPNTAYAVTLRAVCEPGDTSYAVTGSYHTTCVPIVDLPWLEGFEGRPASYYSDIQYVFDDQCWGMLNRSNTSYPYVYNGSYVHSGSNALVITENASVLVLPIFDQPVENLQLSFWALSNPGSNVQVGVLTDPTDATTFQLVTTWAPTSSYEYEYIETTFDGLADAQAIAIRYSSNAFYSVDTYLDDITVMVAPSCSKPQAVSVRNTTSNGTTVVIVDTNAVMNYHLMLVLGNDTVYNQAVTDTVVSITGILTPGNYYTIYVSSLCEDETETSAISGTFNTECEAIASLPYTENFENWPVGSSAPFNPCWAKGNSNGGSYPAVSTESNNKYLYFSIYNGYVYAIMPTIDESITISSLELSFDARYDYSSGRILVGLVDTLAYAAGTAIDTIAELDITSGVYNTEYVSFGEYQGEKRYIILLCSGNNNTNSVYVDNMNLHLIPNCPRPENIEGTVDGTSITYVWSGEAQSYEYRLLASGTGNVVATETVSDTTVTVTDLAIDADYVLELRSVCGSGDTGIWVSAQPLHIGYCVPNATSIDDNGITNVTFGTNQIVNNSDIIASAPYYGNYANLVGDGPAGEDIEVAITYATGYTYGTIIWVDWNSNMVFEGDEVVYYGTSADVNPTVLTATISIPGSQDTGLYRMRIAGADSYFDNYVTSATAAATADPCFSSTYSIAHDYTLRVTEGATCLRPTNLTIDDISGTSVSFSWTPSGEEMSWVVTLNDSVSQTVSSPTCTFDELEALTVYSISVRAYCGGTDTSNALVGSFRTPCTAVSQFPYTDGFEGDDLGCWTSEGDGEWTVGVGDHNTSTGVFEGSQNAKITHSVNGNVTKLISPILDAEDVPSFKITFAHVQRPWSSDLDEHRVLYRTSIADDWVEVASYSYAISSWTVDTVFVPGNAYQIAFEFTDHYGYGVAIDRVVFEPDSTLGIAGAEAEMANVSLFPNPATSTVTVKAEGMSQASVIDINGREVMYRKVNGESTTFDVSTLARGTYFVRIVGEQTVAVRKLIVK